MASLKADANIPVGMAIRPMPVMADNPEHMRPIMLIGTASPYPTVVKVATDHHMARGIEPKVSLGCDREGAKGR